MEKIDNEYNNIRHDIRTSEQKKKSAQKSARTGKTIAERLNDMADKAMDFTSEKLMQAEDKINDIFED